MVDSSGDNNRGQEKEKDQERASLNEKETPVHHPNTNNEDDLKLREISKKKNDEIRGNIPRRGKISHRLRKKLAKLREKRCSLCWRGDKRLQNQCPMFPIFMGRFKNEGKGDEKSR